MQRETINTPKQAAIPPLVLDRQEAAMALRISSRKLDYLIQRGEITATRIDGRVLVAWSELLRFVKRKSEASAPTPRAEDKVVELARA